MAKPTRRFRWPALDGQYSRDPGAMDMADDFPGGTVLVVEDNELNRKLFCDLLDIHGYRTLTSVDGSDVLETVRTHRPALVIMDIRLPQVSGLDLTRAIKDDPHVANTPVLAVTAFAMRRDEELVREAGCEAYISKPIQIAPFMETVRQLVAVRAHQP